MVLECQQNCFINTKSYPFLLSMHIKYFECYLDDPTAFYEITKNVSHDLSGFETVSDMRGAYNGLTQDSRQL